MRPNTNFYEEAEIEHRVFEYQELTDSQIQELRNRLTQISKQEGSRSLAKILSEQSKALVTFLHDKQYRSPTSNKEQLKDKFYKLASDIIQTAQQIDNYKDTNAPLNYSLAQHLEQLKNLNVLFSSNDRALMNPLAHAQHDANQIQTQAFTVAHKTEL